MYTDINGRKWVYTVGNLNQNFTFLKLFVQFIHLKEKMEKLKPSIQGVSKNMIRKKANSVHSPIPRQILKIVFKKVKISTVFKTAKKRYLKSFVTPGNDFSTS